ncbi:hypothetical protein C8R44DRAFT_867180 [Mycena epipterygia]|nr:hypothetical protein C8R44DRAFT_867180 [Mycena epipterygia]
MPAAPKLTGTQKKVHARMSKEKRKTLRLWADGTRETILIDKIETYADALERGWRAKRESLQAICNKFHAKVSWQLEDHEEPALPFPDFDPLALVPEETLPEEEEVAKRTRIDLLNACICRWLKYRARRLRKQLQRKLDPRKDPWAILLAKLSGLNVPPKARQAYQQFMREEYKTMIAPVVAERWVHTPSDGNNVQTSKDPDGPFRAAITREVFAALPDDEHRGYADRAKAEATEAREKCIDRVGAFLAPILQGIHERTGLHSVAVLGGPLPEFGGELRTIYVSYGRSRAAAGQHFPQWTKGRWNSVLELMKEYLASAFTEQDKTEAALPEGLDGAKYKISPDGDMDINASADDDSDLDDDTDSNRDSDDPVPVRKKKAKATEKEGKKSVKRSQKKLAANDSNVESDADEADKPAQKAKRGKAKNATGGKGTGGKGKHEVKGGKKKNSEGASGSAKTGQKKRSREEGEGGGEEAGEGAETSANRSPVRKSRRLNAEASIMEVDAAPPPSTPSGARVPTPPPSSPNTLLAPLKFQAVRPNFELKFPYILSLVEPVNVVYIQ